MTFKNNITSFITILSTELLQLHFDKLQDALFNMKWVSKHSLEPEILWTMVFQLPL